MLITLTDGALAFGKGTGSARPGGAPSEGGASESYLYSLPTSVPTTCTTQLCPRSRLPPWRTLDRRGPQCGGRGPGPSTPLHQAVETWVLGVAGLGIATVAGPTVPRLAPRCPV